MKMTLKNKKEQAAITFTQGEKIYKGRPINDKIVLIESRLDEINDVLCLALSDNAKTAIIEFQLLLPKEGAHRLKKETMSSNKLFDCFISYLMPEVETESPISDCYIPNTLRYVTRKSFIREHQPYYSYKVAILVNQEIFEDISTCKSDGFCIMEKIINAWRMATGLEYSAIKKTFDGQSVSWKEVNNFDDNKWEDYLNAHWQLSHFAFSGPGSHLRSRGSFNCSIC